MSELRPNNAQIGLNLNSIVGQVKPGQLTYALNAQVEGFDGNVVTYQNEQGNTICITVPSGYKVIGIKNIIQLNKVLFWVTNPMTGNSQIGYMDNNDCVYRVLIDDANNPCKFNFDINSPIHKVVVKTTNCSTQVYWTDGLNERRFIDLDDLPWIETIDPLNVFRRIKLVGQLDCNKLKVQPNFSIPRVLAREETIGGNLIMGDYQFGIQYANSLGEGLTSYYNFSNPVGIFELKESPDFNLPTAKSITVDVTLLDLTGLYEYFNIAVVKTINNISSFERIGPFPIVNPTYTYTYTGTDKTAIALTEADIFEKFPTYEVAGDIFEVDNVLGWGILSENQDINYQRVWSSVQLSWETIKLPYNEFEAYNNGVNTELYRGYMRDDVYPLEGCFILKNGKQTRSFHIPGRTAQPYDLEIIPTTNKDNAFSTVNPCDPAIPKRRWEVYNTGSVTHNLFPVGPCPPVVSDPSSSANIFGTIEIVCSDDGCTQQGYISLNITLTQPLAGPVSLLIGSIHESGPTLVGSGYQIYTLPPGVTPDTYYGAQAGVPFYITMPAGSTSFTIPEIINMEGYNDIYHRWICHSCLSTIRHLYIKAVGSYSVQFTQVGDTFEVHNINDPAPPAPPAEPTSTDCIDPCYIGPYQRGMFAYWESKERYPVNDTIWGPLSGQPIRHHKFPDVLVSPIHDNNTANVEGFEHSVFPIGVYLDPASLYNAMTANLTADQIDQIAGFKITRGNRVNNKSVIAKGLIHNIGVSHYDDRDYLYPNYPFNDVREDPYYVSEKLADHGGFDTTNILKGFESSISHSHFTFHSPDTSFFQPFLDNEGEMLKIETIEHGFSLGHFVKVLDNAEYKFLTRNTVFAAAGLGMASGVTIGAGQFGWPEFSMAPVAPTYTAATELFEKLVPYNNFGYTFNSLGNYGNSYGVPNEGDKIRAVDFNKYIIDGINGVEDARQINNIRREKSVYVATGDTLPFPHEYNSSIPTDTSRYNLASRGDSLTPETIRRSEISSYYGSIKRFLPSQWGQMYSYETIDTGFYSPLFDDLNQRFTSFPLIFGGDIFINRFAYKSKLPFFRDNTVKDDNQTDISYDEIGNINYPMFWLSTKPARFDVNIVDEVNAVADEFFDPSFFDILANIFGGGAKGSSTAMNLIRKLFQEIYDKIGIKNLNLDRAENLQLFERGIMYLFSYGVPWFFCESEVNVDFRQATNNAEGDFYPHVGGTIPDDWVQEINVPIAQDNTYNYNKTYSKQNKENNFTHLREDFDPNKLCLREFPNRAIWSDKSTLEETKNNWLVYRPASFYDFPKSYGALIALDGIENRQVLVRFENKTQLYNVLLTAPTSAASVYLGQKLFATEVPPIDYADTDLGFMGSQHKFLLKTQYGHMLIDAKRGGVYIAAGQQFKDLADKDMQAFFSNSLKFSIQESFPDYPIDNHFNGAGLHGVFDDRYNRIIITKLDYEPIVPGIELIDGKFYVGDIEVQLTDPTYFCNKSFTISYDFENQAWISFHSYLPNFYAGNGAFFYSGINSSSSSTMWTHNQDITLYNSFYGSIAPYVLEYPFSYQKEDEILQSVKDYSKVNTYVDAIRFIQTDDNYFNKAIIYNDQQCSGLLNLVHKPRGNMAAYLQYPKYNADSKDILYVKSDNFYNYNGFWDIVEDSSLSIFVPSCSSISEGKVLNTENLIYEQRSFKKYPIRAKDCRIRHILDNTDQYRITSQFVITETQKSYK
jgi:hypothetical protein